MSELSVGPSLLQVLQRYWPLVSVYALGIALAFNVGYFRVAFGNDPYVVTLEDLAKSFLYAVVLILILVPALNALDDLISSTSTKQRWLYSLAFIVVAFSPAIGGVWRGIDTGIWIILHSSFWSIATTAISLLLFAIFHFVRKDKLREVPIVAGFVFTLLLLSLAYSFGSSMFYHDIMDPKQVRVYGGGGVIYDSNLVATRSEFILLFDGESCSFSLVGKSEIARLEYLASKDFSIPIKCFPLLESREERYLLDKAN